MFYNAARWRFPKVQYDPSAVWISAALIWNRKEVEQTPCSHGNLSDMMVRQESINHWGVMLQAIGFRYVSYFQSYRITVFTSSTKTVLWNALTDTGLGAAFSGSSLAIHVYMQWSFPVATRRSAYETYRVWNTRFQNAFCKKLHSSSWFI
jgi:hypothetical protein